MATKSQGLAITVSGGIFNVERSECSWSVPPGPKGQFQLIVHNKSGDWVDVNIDRAGGVAKTGKIENGADGGLVESIDLYLHNSGEVKLTRWRPGVFGVPGNGGGEINWFDPPSNAESMAIEVTVTA